MTATALKSKYDELLLLRARASELELELNAAIWQGSETNTLNSMLQKGLGIACVIWPAKPSDVLSRKRTRNECEARHSLMAILALHWSDTEVSKAFGMDHGTTAFAKHNVENLIATDVKFAERFGRLKVMMGVS